MSSNPFQLSLETVIGASRILGHTLEDRSRIRDQQEDWIVQEIWDRSSAPLWEPDHRNLFCVAPLDILVTENEGQKQFHILELNGTGIGGLTNLTAPAVESVLNGFGEMARDLPDSSPMILVASSGMEMAQSPRRNKLIYEKMLYVEAMKREFEAQGRPAIVTTVETLQEHPEWVQEDQPVIVLGYMKEFLRELYPMGEGRLGMFGRPVSAAVNDRFCLNVVHQFGDQMDLRQFQTMNRCFLAGADKGVAYDLLNDYLLQEPNPYVAPYSGFERAHTREELIQAVLGWVRSGRKAVIKPQGTGLGHGIEFFLSPDESEAEITRRIDQSLQQTENLYAIPGGALPYTVTGFLDSATIDQPSHSMHGRKYELRVVVYRDGTKLRAFPSIAKVSCEVYNRERPSHESLINNITTSAQSKGTAGTEYMLPLSNLDTLKLLNIPMEVLTEVCTFATEWVRFVLDTTMSDPERLGLPVLVDQPATVGAALPRHAAVKIA